MATATETYDGGCGGTKVKLRIGNGGAGQTGLIKALADQYIKDRVGAGCEPFLVAWYESDTTYSIQYLSNNTVDVGITYNGDAEQIAIDNGFAENNRYYVFRDHFLLVGPYDNPACLCPDQTILHMFARLCTKAQATVNEKRSVRFLSRYDKSATNIKESDLWIRIGEAPWATAYSTWYHQFIAFPHQALVAAASLGEYTLTDFGTYLSLPKEIRDKIEIFKKGTEDSSDLLLLPAHLLVGKHVDNQQTARDFAQWIIRDSGQSVIKDFTLAGEPVYTPSPFVLVGAT